jgi:hypothetical protein
MSDSQASCRSLKLSLLEFFGSRVEVSADEGACIVVLPMKTLDNRYVTVYVEPTATDRMLVHDGGDASSELFLQGVNLTEGKLAMLRSIAKRYGATFTNDAFTVVATVGNVNEAILTIAQCATTGMYDLLKLSPVFEEERVAALVKKTLERNPPPNMHIQFNVAAKGGANREHRFDAVALPFRPHDLQTVAVKTLGTAYPANVQSERFLGMALDLRDTEFGKWQKLTVIPRADAWSTEHLKTVRDLSDETIELRTGQDEEVRERLIPTIRALAAA